MMIFPTLHIEFEKWKFNKEYGVWVSNFGNFKDIHKRPIPKKLYSQNGYVSVKTKHGNRMAHRLVMYTWCPIEDREAFTVDHLDHNKRNNRVDNLEWVSQAENLMRANNDIVANPIPVVINANAEPTKPIATAEPTDRDTGKILENGDNTLAKWLATTTDTTCRSFIVQEGITLDTVFINNDGFRGTAMEAIDWLQKHNSKVSTTEEKFFFKLCNSVRMDVFMYSRKWNFLKGVKA